MEKRVKCGFCAEGKQITSIKWGLDRRTGKFAGYCHIVFGSAADAEAALGHHGELLRGRPMKIDAAADGGRRAEDVAAAEGKVKWRPPPDRAANPTDEVRCFVGYAKAIEFVMLQISLAVPNRCIAAILNSRLATRR
eukprot:SAG31_NODE_5166_length_2704_cov_2.110940_3_plen_137_part_00